MSFEGSPVVEPGSLYYLIDTQNPVSYAEARKRLGTLTRQQLLDAYESFARKGKRKELWYVGEELCRRGIPPVFRPWPWVHGELMVPESDLLWIDLQWLVAAYPRHKTKFTRWSRLFTPGHFHKAAGYVHGGALRDARYYVRGLGLTPDQQAELLFIQAAPAKKKRLFLWRLRDKVLDKLNTRHHARPRALAKGEADTIVQRRHAIWLCGSLANWMPQRTANLYKSMTGEDMNRQLANNIMEDVWRDFPESKPKPPRRTRSRSS